MEKLVWQGLLYDFYGELLTDHQKKIYEDVVYENMSLSEIADQYGISRQGVHDIIKRCDAALEGYEDKLGLIARYEKIRSEFEEMKELIDRFESDKGFGRDEFCGKIRKTAESIAQKL